VALGMTAAAEASGVDYILIAGDPAAEFALGQRYENGEGLLRDYAHALALYCAAADQGHAEAAYNIGWMFLNGRGVTRDEAVGAGWLRLSAERGATHAIRVLRHLGAVEPAPPTGCPEPEPALAATPAAPKKIAEIVARTAPKYQVDPKLVLAIISAESDFHASAVSRRNAKGLMQLMPETASRFGVRNSFDPTQNITGGVKYLRWLLAYFEGDIAKVIAAYNAGEGAVTHYGGVPPFPETRAYLAKVRRLYAAKHHPYDRLALAED
jgi:TPR repeat protein